MTSLASTWASPGSPRALGRYELVSEVGRGGMAEVYLARGVGAAGVAKYVAIKRILPHLAREPGFVSMFIDEARVATQLMHPNVCAVFELGQDRDDLFLVMEYLDGLPWATVSHALASCPAEVRTRIAATVIHQACMGLDHVHRRRDLTGRPAGVVHRDISPQNLFVTRDGICKVVDFGISKFVDDPRRTRTGSIKGKPPYMAPEQLRGETVDARTDVWALGVVLWEAIAGRSLFLRDTDYLIFEAVHEASVPSLGALDVVIARAIARDRDDRFSTAGELADAIAAVCPPVTPRELACMVDDLCHDELADRRATLDAALADDQIQTEIDAPIEAIRRAHTYTIVPRHQRRTGVLVACVATAMIAGVIAELRVSGEPSHVEVAVAAVAMTAGAVAVRASGEPARVASAAAIMTPTPPVRSSDSATPSSPVVAASSRAPASPSRRRDATPARSPAASGTLVVDTDGYATVFVDDVRRGDTPLRVALSPGSHRVHGVRAGASSTRIVRITSGTTTPLRLTW